MSIWLWNLFDLLDLTVPRSSEPEWVSPPIPEPERFEELRSRLEEWLLEKSQQDLFVACGIDIGQGPYRKIHIVGPERPVPFSPGAYLDVRIAAKQSEWKGPLPDEWFGLPVRIRFNQIWWGDGGQ